MINQLREQATSQATAVSSADELDKAVMEVVNLRRRVNEAEEEKQKAFARVLVAEGMLKLMVHWYMHTHTCSVQIIICFCM